MTFRIFTMGSNRVLCPTLDVMLKKTILALCEVNVKYNNKLEISGSLHVRSDGGRVFTLLIDEEVMNLATKRDRDFSQGQGYNNTGENSRAPSNGGTVSRSASSSQGRRSSGSSVQIPETCSSSSGNQHTQMPPGGGGGGGRLSGAYRMDREAQSLSSTVPDIGGEFGDEPTITSHNNSNRGIRYARPSSVDSHSMALSAVSQSANATDSTSSAMETGRAGSTLDAIVSNLHSAAMEMELTPNHECDDHSNNSHLNHAPCVPTSYNNVSSPNHINNNNNTILNNNNNNIHNNGTEAVSPTNSSSPKTCSTPTSMTEEPAHVVKVEPTEIPSSSGTPATVPSMGLSRMMVSPMAAAGLDHKSALKMAPVEHVKGGNKKWQCVFCGILVSSKFYLSSHINAVHTRTRIYPCEICGKMFYSHGAQRIHKLRNHWVEKRHKCPFCGQLFVLPFELRQHVQKKHRGQTEVPQLPPAPPPAAAQVTEQEQASK